MLTETDFTDLVLARAKRLIREDYQKYFTKTRINKMVCYLADLLNFDLTRGWYKHGYYSKVVDSHVSSYPSFAELDVEATTFKEVQEKADRIFIYKLDGHIGNQVRNNFIKDGSIFYRWIYSDLAPSNYKSLYNYNLELTKSLKYLSDDVKRNSEKEIKDDSKRVGKALYNLRPTLRFIEDDEILEVYLHFSDLLRMLVISLRKNKAKEDFALVLENLLSLYLNSQSMEKEMVEDIAQYIFPVPPLEEGDIWTILTPYRETVIGRQKNDEISRHTRKIKSLTPKLLEALKNLKKICEDYDLLPSVEDIKAEIRRIDTGDRLPLRELF